MGRRAALASGTARGDQSAYGGGQALALVFQRQRHQRPRTGFIGGERAAASGQALLGGARSVRELDQPCLEEGGARARRLPRAPEVMEGALQTLATVSPAGAPRISLQVSLQLERQALVGIDIVGGSR